MRSMLCISLGFAFLMFHGATGGFSYAREEPETQYTKAQQKEISRLNVILDEEIDVDVIDLPLEQVIADVGKCTKISIFLDEAELRKVSVSRKLPVTINSRESLRKFLTKQLKPLLLTLDVRPDGVHIVAVKADK